ncbi:MAG TPA: thiol:disulfide interchange protein DsbA/DsbL [Luteimonas sp.]|nr:thiol:disulfide interchange protein DsbA/DsbL [Luteimonas sp.]
MTRKALLLVLLLPLAACNKTAPAPDASTPAPTSSSTTPSADAIAAAASAAAAANAPASPAAPAAASSAANPAADAAVASVADAAAKGSAVAGTDYAVIQGGQPYDPLNGKVEVVEVFNFICPACARFEPLLGAWRKTLPADVRLTFVPADFNPQWHIYAQAYLVADAMGLDAKTHDAVFNAIHIEHSLPSESDPPDARKVAAFYAKHGADAQQFIDAMSSFTVDAKLKRAKQFMMASGVEGTPTMIVDGKYRVTGKSDEDALRIVNQLIAQERAAATGR